MVHSAPPAPRSSKSGYDMKASTIAELQDWLAQDEAVSRSHRAERLAKLLAVLPEEEMVFFGGLASAQAYIEIRLAYIHGLYLSTVLLALACIEQELAGALHIRGMDSAANAKLEKLLTEGLTLGIITSGEFQTFNRLREVRNSYTHYRPPTHRTAWARRAMATDIPIDDILEADAVGALSALGAFIDRSASITIAERTPTGAATDEAD
jgi:hypothetical protein